MNMPKDLRWRLTVAAVGALATVTSQRLLALGWRVATGKRPPKLGDVDQSVGQAVTWAVASGIGIGFARLFAQRMAEKWLTRPS